jgi:S1-C subfamily serine protease
VGELPTDPSIAFNETKQNILGVVVENQSNENQRSFIEGVLVTNVDPEGIAYMGGIRKGDIIYSLARIKIKNVNEFKDVLSDLDLERRTTIGVARNGNKRILSLNLSK